MSERNVEIVRELMGYWNERDYDAMRSLFDVDVVVDRTRSMGVSVGVYRGVEESEAMMREWMDTWEWFESRVGEYIDAGDDVVITGEFSARGRGSGATVEAAITQLYTLRDGKVVRHVLFQSRAEALEAAGLTEEQAASRAVSG